jgi:hypothetical protein
MRGQSRRGLFGSVAALAAVVPAAAATATPFVPPPHLDAQLLRLGEMLTTVWAIENEAWANAEGEDDDDGPNTVKANACTVATGEVVDRIEQVHALTLDGLHVKMRAILWCRDGRPVTVTDPDWSDTPATKMRVLASLIADLSRMGSAGA